jgi:hypothetical protein
MMRRLKWVFATTAGLLGALHVGLTALLYRQASLEALWFSGAGLAIAAVGLMNIVDLRARDQSSPLILFAANSALACFFIAAWSFMKAPQVALGVVIFAGLAACDAFRSLNRFKSRT